MSGDLEDFLRRAAQRRQAKAAQGRGAQGRGAQGPQGGARPGARVPPQYSNRKTERLVPANDADEILMAEVVEEEETDSISARMRRLEAAKQAAAEAESQAKARLAKRRGTHPTSSSDSQSGPDVDLSVNPAEGLIRLLRQPGGLKQAILLKEILDRPEHRW